MDQATPGFERRFWAKVTKTDGCWPWTGTRTELGYGRVSIRTKSGKRPVGAHRVAWFLTYGPIPDGLEVLHRCDNPPCCRPEHLRLGTHAQNMADMAVKKRGGSWGERRTHCPKGHPYEEDNIYWRRGKGRNEQGYRDCRTCALERARQYRERNR